MAAKGAGFLFLVLLLFPFLSLSSSPSQESDETTSTSSPLPPSLLDRHEAQLARLETLVESLSKSVSALEATLSRSDLDPITSSLPSPPPPAAAPTAAGGVAVTKRKPLWSERFHFAAAARLDSGASAAAAAALPYEDLDGLTKYFAVGDSLGRVFVFSTAGDAILELPSVSGEVAVTSLLAYLSPRRTDCLLFAGHADGSIAAHRLTESSPHGDDWLTLSVSSSRLFVGGLDGSPVLSLEFHQSGRYRYVLSCDRSGRIRFFTENGTLYGTVIASARPLAFAKQRLLFLTESGTAASLDLRSMSVRETECEGLNSTVLPKAYSFDPSERSKAYGFTADGDLVHVVLLGDVANLKCRVRAVRRAEIENPVAIQTIKGYLLVVSQDKIFVYNISSQYYGRVGAPRPLFFTTIKEIKSVFANPSGDVPSSAGRPLIAADRDKLVILGLGDGYIAVYRSNFPVYKVDSDAVVWSGPALLFLLFLIGIWQFYVKKKDSLGWTPDESFNTLVTAPSSSLLNHTSSSDRGYVDGTRAVDLRGGALRGAPRRYVSPPRYTGAAGIPYRPVSAAEPSVRGPAELKYRGPSMEPPGFPKKRDPLFPNNQTVDDHVN